MLPGNVTDMTFLNKLNMAWKDHPHYESRALRKNQSDRSLPHDAFRLKHYAGSVSCFMYNFPPPSITPGVTHFMQCKGMGHAW